VREFQKEGLSLKEAMEKAVYYCRKHDILKELLEKHAKEIMSMLTTETMLSFNTQEVHTKITKKQRSQRRDLPRTTRTNTNLEVFELTIYKRVKQS